MTGFVSLVGSGPGDPDLLTVKARRLLDEADVILHDKLPGPAIIDSLPDDRCEDVGKRAGGERTTQCEINERLVTLAKAGNHVVRLKGGDPFVFGRGGEEAEYLADHGVPFEVVPAVTSAIAAPAVAGIPVTHRDHASSVTFVTGHEDPTKPESTVDWETLAETDGTIVVLMGVGKLDQYTAALRSADMPPDTPVAMIERATWPNQRVGTGTLETIVAVRDELDISPPAVTVIGDVASTRESVRAWLANDTAVPDARWTADAIADEASYLAGKANAENGTGKANAENGATDAIETVTANGVADALDATEDERDDETDGAETDTDTNATENETLHLQDGTW